MGKFNEYSQKATPEDADSLMIYDAAAKANKLSPFSGIWNWIVEKLTNAVISNLQTSNQTVVGALNELNSKASKTAFNGKASKTAFNGNISRITFRSGSVGINNAYLDFWTDDGNRTTIGFYTDGVSGIQMLKNDTVVWNLKP